MMRIRMLSGLAVLLAMTSAALAQDERHEVSIQGTGFFTRDTTDNNGIPRTNTNSGGLLAGYRYRINKWIAAEGDYGFTRNTQLFSGAGTGRIQSDVHAVTGAVVVNLPLQVGKLSPYVLRGGGALA